MTECILAIRSELDDQWFVYTDKGKATSNFIEAQVHSSHDEAEAQFRCAVNASVYRWFEKNSPTHIPPSAVGYIGPPALSPEQFQPTTRWLAKPNPKERRTEFEPFHRESGVRFGHEHVF